jgi:hypothetical protein
MYKNLLFLSSWAFTPGIISLNKSSEISLLLFSFFSNFSLLFKFFSNEIFSEFNSDFLKVIKLNLLILE